MFLIMISIFLAGIILVALEDKIGINKAASALLMSVVLWVLVAFSGVAPDVNVPFITHLGDVSETLFFVMGSMVIVELVDTHGGFKLITDSIHTNNKRRLLWIISILTFFVSAILDNLATGIVMIALLRKLIPHRTERIIYASMIIIAANAGGSWSPIGDVTTILLWTGGNITPIHQISHLFLPALVSMLVPLLLVSRFFKKDASWSVARKPRDNGELLPIVSRMSRRIILFLGVTTMAFVPIFNEWSALPPFMYVMFGVSFLWIYTDLMYGKMHQMENSVKLRVTQILSRIDMSTILFFFGILMSVAALDTSGQLITVSSYLTDHINSELSISFLIGLMSSFVDNVALVAATMGMYPIDPSSAAYMVNGDFWTFLAYCAVTGGSILIIGSATGVTVMGMEKISFMYYFKRFTLIALAGYVAGAGTYMLLSLI
ncbi:MAG: sodium:proton antiporter NhaD [Rikenellaceae bacterium]